MGLAHRNAAALMSGVALGILALSQAARAEDEETSATRVATTALQRIVVGAGVEKVAIDTPQAVTVIDQEEIDSAQATTIADIFRQTPGVTMVGSDRVGGQSFNIRGIGELGAPDESKIIVSVDGAVKFFEQYRMGSFFSDPELYKQVEVLRGPASSTLYGAGALGGVINFTTKDASDFLDEGETVAVRLKSMYDSNKDGVLASGIVAVRLSPQTEALLSGNFRRADDYKTGNGTVIAGSAFEALSGLAKVTHRFGEDNEQTVRLSYERWQSDADDTEYSQTGTFAFGTIDREITDQTVVFAYENPASGNPLLDFKLNLSFSDTSVHQDNASMRRFSTSPLFLDSDYAYRTWQAKAQNTFEMSSDTFQNYLTVGSQVSHQQRIGSTTAGYVDFHPEGTDTKVGFFVQDEFIWNERLTIIPGARVDFVSLAPDASVPGANSSNDIAFSPKIAAMYKFTDSFSVFGSIAHTERLPTLDEMFSASAATATYPGGRTFNPNLKKEKSNNFEAGFAISHNDVLQDADSIQLKTTAFYNDLTDLIASGQNQGQARPVPYFVNVHRAHIYGVEVEAAYESRYVFANLAYTSVRGENETTGQDLTSIPSDKVAVTLGGRLPDYGVDFGWRALFASSIDTGATTGPFAGYAVHDAFVNWKLDEGQFKGLELRASVENIFDKRYRDNLAGDDGKGRTFKLSLAKKFGW
ncbi:TonB-dependent hemoglobin/transferrin/lactoferrin family receptor [Polymorphum gilvum]|uniref:TonB-dependent heme/hemoglobin receptor family protein n=1 Tax=Polymorphum gilvum (strain LMG 25793 / CGMCC 1.9160 / SL003B-26A1) TaxID=991905 RepID=F2IZW5_POLGS|nr:TonB-dependent hemoglobin/transferrin/lactoferrin family receptor [Polymorphum gilvum]ADZ70691.1 TonB-dependent heme/hemoglobin receptor family protein [Polymorphum gilvum SL003B-26A1]